MRRVLFSLLLIGLVAAAVSHGAWRGTYSAFSDDTTGTLNLQAGYWTATITIEKLVATGDEFTFDATGVPGCDSDKTLGNNQTFSCTYNALGGADDYDISETVPGGWNNPGIVCEGTGSTRVTPSTPGISFDLDPQDNVTCTFTNTPQTGSVTIVKQVAGGNAEFDFQTTGAGLSNFQIDTAVDNSTTFASTPVGEKTIAETSTDGWSFISVSCVDGNASPIGTPNGPSVTFTLAANDSVTCTFTNTKNAILTVDKDYTDNNTVNNVTINVAGCTVAANAQPADEDTNAVFTVTNIPYPAGTVNCTATETNLPAGYTKNEAPCASVAVAAGSTNATCTITNTLTSATFTVYKDYVGADGPPVDISLTCASGTPTTSPMSADEGAPAVFTVTGFTGDPDCDATEGTAPTGYTKNEAGCIDVALVAEGECTITNTLNSTTFTVYKDYVGGDGPPVSIGLSCASGTPTTSPMSADEGAPAVFTVTAFTGDPDCDATEGAAPTGYTKNEAGCVDVALVAEGECTITNTLQATGSITIVKDARGYDGAEDLPGTFGFTSSVSAGGTALSPASPTLDDNSATGTPNSVTYNSLAAATYSITEQAQAGWAIASITCQGSASVTYTGATVNATDGFQTGDTTVNISISGSQSATCTFLNIQVPPSCQSEVEFSQPNPVTVFVPAGGALYAAENGAQILIGTSGDDWVRGGTSKDCILGLGGNDVLIGDEGTDALFGGEGNDDLYGLNGTDYLGGGNGDDYCDGGNGPETLDSCEAASANQPGKAP